MSTRCKGKIAKRGKVHFPMHKSELGSLLSSGSTLRLVTVTLTPPLLVQNADPSKPIVALGQTYFAVQTRRQEIADELAALPEDQLRLIRRSQMTIYNNQLAEAAQGAGVIEPIDFAIFQDHGYMGLYGGLKAQDIHTRKGLCLLMVELRKQAKQQEDRKMEALEAYNRALHNYDKADYYDP